MTVDEAMKGKRVFIDEDRDLILLPGEYGQDMHGDWYCMSPNSLLGNLRSHDVVEHEDLTITVSPSILISTYDNQQWHGYLKKGVWREC